MQINIHPTEKVINIKHSEEHSPIQARVWEGTMEDGTPIACLIVRVAVPDNISAEKAAAIQEQLTQTEPPTAAATAFPLSIIL